MIGLGNVDNTSDLSKPVSSAVQSALDTKCFTSQLTQFLGNFTMAGGGILTLRLISGVLYLLGILRDYVPRFLMQLFITVSSARYSAH